MSDKDKVCDYIKRNLKSITDQLKNINEQLKYTAHKVHMVNHVTVINGLIMECH